MRGLVPGGACQRPAKSDYDGSKAVDGDPATYWATEDGTKEASIEVELDGSRPFDRVVLSEPIALGQRVRRFRLSVPAGPATSGNHRDWRTIAEGTTVGHRRIVRVPLTNARRVRVEVLDARACPLISHVGVHRTVPDAAGAWPPSTSDAR